jgi:hypothetical protein
MAYQESEVQFGSFIGWGERKGQVIEGVVTDYDPEGATDFGGKPCPSLEIELLQKGHSFSKKDNSWTTYEAGESVQITCGQVQLKKKVRKAQPRIADKIRIELVDLIRVTSGTVKSFKVEIDHSGGGSSSDGQVSAPAEPPADDPWGNGSAPLPPQDDEPPF